MTELSDSLSNVSIVMDTMSSILSIYHILCPTCNETSNKARVEQNAGCGVHLPVWLPSQTSPSGVGCCDPGLPVMIFIGEDGGIAM
jgi:hypothetical protein